MTNSAAPDPARAQNPSYDNDFYLDQVDGSLTSARIFLDHLFNIFEPKTVIDIGCGRGTWLKAFGERGTITLVGHDGPWNSQSQMIDDKIRFVEVDLNKPFTPTQRFDLALSLEVAEHLRPEHASAFVDALTSCSDVIMFGAAIKGQPGADHINAQYHSYWGKLYSDRGYAIFDYFRPKFWSDDRVKYWYRQNTFLYIKRSSPLIQQLAAKRICELPSLGFMDCIHPTLFEAYQSGEVHFYKFIAPAVGVMKRLIPRKAYNAVRSLARRHLFR